jgi:tetratricopeptide (TPR) repeat protein
MKETNKSSAIALKADLVMAFNNAFSPIEVTLFNPESWFSMSGMWADLSEIEPVAEQLDPDSSEMARWYHVHTLLCYKGEYAEDVLRYGELCLAIQEKKLVYTTSELMGIYSYLFKSALEVEINGIEAGDESEMKYESATSYVKRAIKAFEAIEITTLQRLGLRQDLGFYLHEEKQFQQAFETNKQTLVDAEIALGKDNGSLTEIVINLAQNSYELKKFGQTRVYLLRALDLARNGKRVNYEFDVLFQLGVLASELGDNNGALVWFDERLKVAKREADEFMIEEALDKITELRERMGEQN